MKDQVGYEAELETGSGGIFDVFVDGQRIFSKHVENRFPENEEILERLPEH